MLDVAMSIVQCCLQFTDCLFSIAVWSTCLINQSVDFVLLSPYFFSEFGNLGVVLMVQPVDYSFILRILSGSHRLLFHFPTQVIGVFNLLIQFVHQLKLILP